MKDRIQSGRDRAEAVVDRATALVADKIDELKPHLRGWMHAGSVPLLTAAFAILIAFSPTTLTIIGNSIYAASALLLFTVSGIYHRGNWQPKTWAFWRRFDHSNIFVFIAGTYTPFAFLYLDGTARWLLFGTAWGFAIAGTMFKLLWPGAPRFLATAPYVVMGWLIVFFIPALAEGAKDFPFWLNVSALTLVAAGGILYTLGAVVYGLKRPNPWPTVFGFHEVFHLCTVLAFVCQYIAVSMCTYYLR